MFINDSAQVEVAVLEQLERALRPTLHELHVKWLDEHGSELASIDTIPSELPPVFDGDHLQFYALTSQKPSSTHDCAGC